MRFSIFLHVSLMFYIKALALSGVKYQQEISSANYIKSVLNSSLFDSTLFTGKANFTHTTFQDTALFKGSWFSQEATFEAAQFDSKANFSGATFDSVTNFHDAKFHSEADFFAATFDSEANFSGSTFGSVAEFTDATFDSVANFHDAKFHSEANFYGGATFNSEARFIYLEFYSNANFSGATFGSVANFWGAKFDSGAHFLDVKFNLKADFDRASFKNAVDFHNVTLPDTLIFSNIKEIKSQIDFTYTHLDSGKHVCLIDLYGTDIDKLKFDYSYFRILKDTARYEKLHYTNVYEQVLKMQKEQGFIDGYEKADKEYQHLKLTDDEPFFSNITGWISSIIQDLWWGYGYNKSRIWGWTIGLLLIFSIINLIFFRSMNDKVYKIDKIYDNWQPASKVNFSSVVAGIGSYNKATMVSNLKMAWASLCYTSLIFFGLRLDSEKIHFDHPLGVFYLFIQYTIGLICLASLANLIIVS